VILNYEINYSHPSRSTYKKQPFNFDVLGIFLPIGAGY